MCQDDLQPLVIVSRDTWGALPPKSKGLAMDVPLHNVIVSFNAEIDKGETQEDCSKILKDLQKKHMEEKGFSDIGYNFVIGGDAKVYEGRGWAVQPESTIYPEMNGKRLDIAYMGDHDRNNLPVDMLMAALQLLSKGVETGLLAEDFNNTEYPESIDMDDPE